MNPSDNNDLEQDIDVRVIRGDKVPCPICGQILIYQQAEDGKHPAIICPNEDYSVLLEVKQNDILEKLGLRKKR
ncbi:hypothetical protein [Paenibacillus wenxiniae]|uniref:Uncharacterized protein n=1 Tax=Paenibacillus wenxiniae TaxID=1636843 RepID=A0ABW4RKF2_9BACL